MSRSRSPLEKVFKARVQRILKTYKDLWFFKTNELSISGIPDILGCYKGLFIALELKRDSKSEATTLQLDTIELIKKAGGFATVVYPENLDQILKELELWVKEKS